MQKSNLIMVLHPTRNGYQLIDNDTGRVVGEAFGSDQPSRYVWNPLTGEVTERNK
jgi:hypothetical protein